MPSVKSLKKITPYVWIPPRYYPVYKIQIERSSGQIDDITDYIYSGELIDGVTDTIGNFEFVVDNSSRRYMGVWNGNEIIRIYMDYATSATTLRFRGRIEQVSYRGYQIKIKGRAEGKKLLEVTVTKSYTNQETSTILTNLISRYASSFTTTNVNVSSTNLTANWYQKPLWECIQELCHASGYDCYVDNALDVHYFEDGSINNSYEGAVHNSNLFEVGDFAYDYSQIKNRIIVYGGKQEDMDIIATAEDTDSQDDYGIKEKIINDNSITTDTQAQERADYELALYKDPPLVGDVKCIGLPTIQPGENIYISAPYSNLNPNYYKVLNYKHSFGDLFTTTLTIEKEPKKIAHLIKERIGQEQKLADMPNPNEMRYSWIETFDSDSGTHTNTEITDGLLKLQTGQSSGNWVSDLKTITSNATNCELRVNGSSLAGTNYYVSTDGGNNWQTISGLKTSITLSPPGLNLKVKIELNSANTEINSINLLYKT